MYNTHVKTMLTTFANNGSQNKKPISNHLFGACFGTKEPQKRRSSQAGKNKFRSYDRWGQVGSDRKNQSTDQLIE